MTEFIIFVVLGIAWAKAVQRNRRGQPKHLGWTHDGFTYSLWKELTGANRPHTPTVEREQRPSPVDTFLKNKPIE